MTKQVYLGTKIRRLRKREGWSQAELATQLGISASYLNLIEHNKRSLTVPLLLRLTQVFKVDLAGFARDDETAVQADLREIFADTVFAGHELTSEDVHDLATQAPAAARAVLDLYRAYRSVRDDAQAIAARLSDGDAIASLEVHQPPEQVSDLLQDHRNHFPAIETAAEALWRDARLEQDGLQRGLIDHLQRAHGVRVEVRIVETPQGAVRWFDPERSVLTLSEVLPRPSLVFQLAHQIALLSLDPLLDKILQDSSLPTAASRTLARVALANYFAGAVMLPYDRFLEAARSTRHDIEILQHRFHASFEQVCHRLTTLNRTGQSGVPFHFVRIDIAGNISKRYSGSGIRISRYSGACPRWNVHTAFMTPGQIQTQISQMPDGTTYFCIARTVRKPGGGHRAPQRHLAVGLGCRIEHAGQLVYADAVKTDLDAAVPIGIGCRICERVDCQQRAFPPLQRPLEIDVNRRGLSFYAAPGRG